MASKKIKILHEVRASKTGRELANIVRAQRISEKVLSYMISKLRTGITELEVEKILKKQFIKHKAPILAFPPIVAFGKNTANIHHTPDKTRLREGDFIMFDFGTSVNHYCSDMTRTFFWGKPNKKQVELYTDVLKAQKRALKRLAKGVKKAKAVDASAREFLRKKYKPIKYKDGRRRGFTHGLGHGVGTVIHEWPNFMPGTEDKLPVGCVMTVEPGVYLPGFGGVRIEDMVLITKKGYKNLTQFPKDLESMILEPK